MPGNTRSTAARNLNNIWQIFLNLVLEEIGSKIDELQKDVSDLMTQAGIENPDDVVVSFLFLVGKNIIALRVIY
uniref:Uncharacterized protein n=1 Tax=Leptobrachium leishanense TaxID=445787 RepID=A0A8C5MFC6_9ANUR